MNISAIADVVNWDPARVVTGAVADLTSEQMFEGDWAKGPAGGYGTKQTDWAFANSDLFDVKTGFMGEDVKWTFDAAKNEGSIVYNVRKGVHFALDTKSEASRLVNGREMTADDVLYSFIRNTTWNLGYVYLNQIELRTANITKTGPWEITVKVPATSLIMAISRYNDTVRIVPHEVVEKYKDMEAWQRVVGTGAFMLTNVVPGSIMELARNPNYYQTNPVGPGKGDQLPYIDEVKIFILPDASTRLAAMRTGKLDLMSSTPTSFSKEDALALMKNAPQLKEYHATSFQGRGNPPLNMRIDTAPFNDVRVRRAMLMCVDYKSILAGYFGGEGQIYTWPHSLTKEYQELYLNFNDYPDTAKELFSYNPEKAKQLLKEAGYPNGFKTSIILVNTEVDFVSIYKDYLSRIGIDMALDVRETAAKTNIQVNKTHTQMITGDTAPIAIFYNGQPISGTSHNNRSMVDDKYINDNLVKIRTTALTDIHAAMSQYREMTKYVVDQAYAIPAVIGSYYTLWWPWLKNYSGEINIGYDDPIYPTYIWIDRDLKKSMGK
jgi:peptide/nickel transport system substrate-binding protein